MPIRKNKPEQIVTLPRQIEVEIAKGKTAPQACKKGQITAWGYYRWQQGYGGLKLDLSVTVLNLKMCPKVDSTICFYVHRPQTVTAAEVYEDVDPTRAPEA
ncbi:MAG: hypothetical protein WCE61_04735 [Candidatus Acidiferrum sp.]